MAVTVVRGFGPALISYFASPGRAPAPDRSLYFAEPPGPPRSLGAVRLLLAQLRPRLGESRFEEILSRHAPAAALLLPGRRERLAPEGEVGVRALAARTASHMTHNFVLQHPIFEAWAALFVDLLSAGPFSLIAPSQALLGWEDGAFLKALYRHFPERAPDLVLGFDPGFRSTEDADGILWPMSTYRSLALAMDLQALQEQAPVDLPDEADSGAAWDLVLGDLKHLEDDPDDWEAQAWSALAAASITPEIASRAVKAQRACFESFAFTSALRLGLELLAKEPALAPLPPLDAADVHGIVALSGHNRQFLTQSPALVDFLDRHLAAAMALESRPALRCALYYRLAVVHGRRKKDQETAIRWARQGVEAAEHPGLSRLESAYQGAWARNILAYVLMRLGRLEDAETETVAGFERLDALLTVLPELIATGEAGPEWALDVRASHSLLAFNTYTLLDLLQRGNAETSDWLRKSRDVVRSIPSIARFDAFHWHDFYKGVLRPDLALPFVLRGLEDARREVDAMRGYELALDAADLCERLGKSAEARGLYEQIQTFRLRCGLVPLRAIEISWAQACHREGRFDEARSRFAALLAGEAAAEARAELLAASARVEADAGDEAAAERLLDEAVDLAIESGDRETLLRVAIAAGRCHRALGRFEDARDDFEQALEIAESGGPPVPDIPPVRPADLLGALLGAWESGLGDPGLASRAVRAASVALADAEAWGELPRLLTLLGDSVPEPGMDADFERIHTAARQRVQ